MNISQPRGGAWGGEAVRLNPQKQNCGGSSFSQLMLSATGVRRRSLEEPGSALRGVAHFLVVIRG